MMGYRLMETLELDGRGRTGHRALADGPADGELVLLLHGFPETSYEWRAPARRRSVPPATAPSPPTSGATRRARDPRRRRLHDRSSSSPTWSGSPTPSASSGSTSSATTGAASSRGTSAGAHGDRLRTLTVVSTPHPTPFRGAMHGSGSDQREKSSYMHVVPQRPERRGPVPRRRRRTRSTRLYAEHPRRRGCDEYRRVFTADGGAALTGGLNWYRANDFRAEIGPITVAHDVRVVDRRRRARSRGGRGHRGGGRRARTASRCSTT